MSYNFLEISWLFVFGEVFQINTSKYLDTISKIDLKADIKTKYPSKMSISVIPMHTFSQTLTDI